MSAVGIVDEVALAAAYRELAGELGLPPTTSETALRIALREAEHLADDVYDVPAALLFALGRTPRCFAAFRAMGALVVLFHAKALGFRLDMSPLEIGALLVAVARREVDYPAVRVRVAERLFPFGG